MTAAVTGLLLAAPAGAGSGMAAPLAPATAPVAGSGGGAAPFDFDGDGYPDLAIGVPREDIGAIRNAGAVQILYGSASGPTARDQIWHQNRRGVKGAAEGYDRFGDTLASGDFDGDGYADLAVGIPREDIGRVKDAGAVAVLYGSPRGLTARDQIWHRGSAGVPGSGGSGDRFGASLAVGDFDSDGVADLAVGSPYTPTGDSTGQVVVLRGARGGLTSAGARAWDLPGLGLSGLLFGEGLAAGDLSGDGRDDLVASATGERVYVLLGSGAGLTAAARRSYDAGDLGITALESTGSVMHPVTGDFDGDGRCDLAVWRRGFLDRRYREQVAAVFFEGSGPVPRRTQAWLAPAQTSFSPVGHRLPLVAGDLTGDGRDDLVIGWEVAHDGVPGAGQVQVLTGSSAGLRQAAMLTQQTAGIPGSDGAYDAFGGSLAILPGRPAWLSIGVPGKALAGLWRAGWVVVVRGSAAGVATAGSRVWHQDSPGIKGAAEQWDAFGEESAMPQSVR